MKEIISVTVKPSQRALESPDIIAKEILLLLNKKQIVIDVEIKEFGFLNKRFTYAKYNFGRGIIRAGCSEGTRSEQIRRVVSLIFEIEVCKNKRLSDDCVREFIDISPNEAKVSRRGG